MPKNVPQILLCAVAALTLVFVAGCTSMRGLKMATSGHIGCPESEIGISERQGVLDETWVAQCRGKTFYCSSSAGQNGVPPQISCRESASAAAASKTKPKAKESKATEAAKPAVSPGGCEYDTQCKGDRICVNRACTSPAPSPSTTPSTDDAAQPAD